MPLTATSRPALWRLARMDFDPVRRRRVLLYPEGTIMLNATAAEILDLCDGERTVADIAATLSARYHTDVSQDVTECLSRLADQEVIRDGAG
ncbi:MAG TPA: pyrroloquinoline quinone biosynthesis peptide chaperone PqqD [Gemmatimonadaceae bacterium]|nr:pyrroloquinoline quinone biosynthesis peptide chaperone PqqD [Gemmatimonadaceae bacterium]